MIPERFYPGEWDLLRKLVDEGSMIIDKNGPEDGAMHGLVLAGVAEVILGKDRSILKATLAGRRAVLEWREAADRASWVGRGNNKK